MGTLTDLGYKLTDGANQIDQAIMRALTYPDASDGSVGQVPTIGADGIEWEDQSGGSDANLATVESTSTASQAYAVNSFLIYNGQLYRVTAAIAQGDTLTVGTNIAVADAGTYLAMVAAANAVASAGVAPGGFGLGANDAKVITDWNDATSNGWYRAASTASHMPSNIGTNYGSFGFVSSGWGNTTVLQVIYVVLGGAKYAECHRYCLAGSWSDWEYVNPPLATGTEYRTTELFLGKPVYAQVVDCGTLPNAASKQVTYTATNIKNIIERKVVVRSMALVIPDNDIDVWINGTTIYVTTTADYSGQSAAVIIKYTKTTD